MKRDRRTALIALVTSLALSGLASSSAIGRGEQHLRKPAQPARTTAKTIYFTPVSIELPTDDTQFADIGAVSAETINGNCLACHSAALVLTQPKLTSAEWAGEVVKMRHSYGAPVAEADDAAIVAWLSAHSAAMPAQGR